MTHEQVMHVLDKAAQDASLRAIPSSIGHGLPGTSGVMSIDVHMGNDKDRAEPMKAEQEVSDFLTQMQKVLLPSLFTLFLPPALHSSFPSPLSFLVASLVVISCYRSRNLKRASTRAI